MFYQENLKLLIAAECLNQMTRRSRVSRSINAQASNRTAGL
jgi:hypothetical protein